jgi:hypothetical protein
MRTQNRLHRAFASPPMGGHGLIPMSGETPNTLTNR